MIRPGVLVFGFCSILLTACGSTDAGAKKSAVASFNPPEYAYSLPSAENMVTESVVVAGSHKTQVKGTPWGYLPNGSVLIDRYPEGDVEGAPSVIVDPKSGMSYADGKKYDSTIDPAGVSANSLLTVHHSSKGKLSFREFDFRFALKREISLPGKSLSLGFDKGKGTTYGWLAGTGKSVFITRTEWSGIDSTGDMLTRISKSGKVTNVLKNKHVSNLTLSSDGRSILASLASDSPYYEAVPGTKDIVELDPVSGEIRKSFGVPPPCKVFKRVMEQESCLDRIDKVGDVVAVSVFESVKQDDRGFSGYSTWKNKDGKWSEVKSQRDKTVYWQSGSDRLEQAYQLRFDNYEDQSPIEWISGGDRKVLGSKGNLSIREWRVPGSLIRP
ncbi:MAG: hypothetical protein ABIR57_08390 [Aeromicrobium sp.]